MMDPNISQLQPANDSLMDEMLWAMNQPPVDDIHFCLREAMRLSSSSPEESLDAIKAETSKQVRTFPNDTSFDSREPDQDVEHAGPAYIRRAILCGTDNGNFSVLQSKQFALRLIHDMPESFYIE